MAEYINQLCDPDNWQVVYAECQERHVWAYVGPEVDPCLSAQAMEASIRRAVNG